MKLDECEVDVRKFSLSLSLSLSKNNQTNEQQHEIKSATGSDLSDIFTNYVNISRNNTIYGST